MSNATVLDEIMGELSGVAAQRRRAVAVEWGGLIRDVADGRRPAADRVERVLGATGRTLDDVRAGVQQLVKRREWADQVTAGHEAAAERPALETATNKVIAEFEAAREKYVRALQPLNEQRAAIEDAEAAAEAAKEQLRKTCSPELGEELARVQLLHGRAHDGRHALRVQADKRKTAANLLKRVEDKYLGTAGTTDQDKRDADRLTREADEADAALPDVERELGDLQQQEARILERMLVP